MDIKSNNRLSNLTNFIKFRNKPKPKPEPEKPKLMDGFKFIPDFGEYYSISEAGEIFSHRRNMFIKPYTNRLGYLVTLLYKDNRKERKHYYIHRLVAMTYIPNPENKPDINHIDGNKSNCHAPNLEWVTKSENSQHMYDTGLRSYDLFNNWVNWSPAQLAEFEQSPYNIPACGNYNYPADLKTSIDDITAAEKLAVSF